MRPLVLVPLAVAAAFSMPVLADDDPPEMSGSIRAFHDKLSPDWHAAPGPGRISSACGNAGDYIRLSDEIGRQPVPDEQQAAAWSDAVGGLRDASAALRAYCTSRLDANVEAGLSILHERFHDLIKALRRPR